MESLVTPLPSYAYDIGALLIVLFFVLRGIWRGLIKESAGTLSLLLSIPLSYPIGYGITPVVLKQYPSLPEFIQKPIALGIGGIAAYILLRILFAVIIYTFKLKRDWQGKAKRIVRIGGGILGGLFGVAVVLLICWYILLMGLLVKADQPTPDNKRNAQLLLPGRIIAAHREGLKESYVGRFAVWCSPIPDSFTTGVEVLSEVTSNPDTMMKLIESEPVQKIMQSEAVQNLANDPEIRAMAEQGRYMELMSHPSVQKAMNDPEIQEMMKNMDEEEMRRMLEGAEQ